jgi:hypothetical protein
VLSRLLRALALAIAIATVLTVTARTRADVDLWGHLRFGLDLLQTGSLEPLDRYSFTSDRPWVNHEWLSEIAIALAWKTAGAPGLIFLKLACIFGALALTASAVGEQGVTGRPRILLLGLTFVGILPRVAQVRPQIFSVVLFATLVRLIVRSDRGSSRPLLWTIPALTLWANLHGGWLVGLGTVGLACAGKAWDGRRTRPAIRAVGPLLIAALAAAATLINPYGVGLWAFMIETVRFGREGIGEWGPIWLEPSSMIVWPMFAALLLTALGASVRRPTGQRLKDPHGLEDHSRRPSAVRLAIPVLLGAAALRVNRLDTFFALSTIGFLAGPLASLLSRRTVPSRALPPSWTLGAAAAALVLVLSVPVSRAAFTCIGIHPTWPESGVVEMMRERHLLGRVVTFFDWGEYAIWNMPAGLKVSMDGRRETVYSERTVHNHLQLYLGTDTGLSYLHDLKADYVWLPSKLPVIDVLVRRGWHASFDGARSVLLSNLSPAEGTLTTSDSRTPATATGSTKRCFPGP